MIDGRWVIACSGQAACSGAVSSTGGYQIGSGSK